MSEQQQQRYTAAELADTGRWHLTVMISDRKAAAWLKYIDNTSEPLMLFDTEFDSSSPLAEQLENVLYDNPRVLDDFSADIVADTDKVLWLPSDVCSQSNIAHAAFAEIWPELADEFMTHKTGSETCLFALHPGIRSLLARTFPGARFCCRLSAIRELLFPPISVRPKSIVSMREDDTTDFIAVGEKGLLFAVNRPREDTAATAAFLAEAFSLCGQDRGADILIDGDFAEADRLRDMLASHNFNSDIFDSPCRRMAPELPLAAALSATRRSMQN